MFHSRIFRSRVSQSGVFWSALLLCLSSVVCFAAPKPDEDAAAQSKTNITIAIADFDGNDKELTHFIADTLLTDLQQSDRLNLVDRSALKPALAEMKFQASGLVEPQQVKKLGQLVSADQLIVGGFMVHNDELAINARLISVKTGRLVPGSAASVSGRRKDLSSLVTLLARQFHKRVTGEELLAGNEPVTPRAGRLRIGAAVPDVALGNLLTYYQEKGLIPLAAAPETPVMEGDLARLVGSVARSLSAPNDYVLATSQPALPVTRIRVLAALVKLAETPDSISAFRGDLSRPRPIDGDVAPTWGLPYLAAALSEGWLRADEAFKPRNVANWTFVSALLARLPINGPAANSASESAVRPVAPRVLPRENEEFTGLVVDAGLLDAQRGPGASIVDEQGVLVYPAAVLTSEELDILDDKGIVGYCETLTKATRAGEHPLVVEAIDVKGASHCQLVVSNETAEKIRAAERRNKFLSRWAVCFLTRPAQK